MSKRKELKYLVGAGYHSEDEQQRILEAFGMDVRQVSYLQVFVNDNYIGDTNDSLLEEIVDIDSLDDEDIEQAFEELQDEFDLIDDEE